MTTLRITIDIFSGRANPVFELGAKASREALGLLAETRRIEKGEPGLPPEPTLGYRGLIVEQVGARSRKLPRTFRVAHETVLAGATPLMLNDDAFEQSVLGSAQLSRQRSELPKLVKREVARFRRAREGWPWRPHHKHYGAHRRCHCAPLYEPAWWNDPSRQFQNNCYNYGSNYRTNTFAQPGLAAGAMYGSLTGPAVRAAAVADKLIDSPSANNHCPGEGHLVALVIAPGIDFHWYRKGRTGLWTHKPGSTPATNVDNSGHIIPDPRTADRGMYTQFTTFMVVMHGHIKIQ
jgi:hypothetical protein